MPDDLLGSGAPGSGLDSPGPGAALNPTLAAGAIVIAPASSYLVNTCNKYDGTPRIYIFGADTLVVQTSPRVAAYPTTTLTCQFSTDGHNWVDSTTITTATSTRLNTTSGNPTGYLFARVIVTTAASGSEQLITITITALKTGT